MIPFFWSTLLGRWLFINIYIPWILEYRYISKDKRLAFVPRATVVHKPASTPQWLPTDGMTAVLSQWSIMKAQSWGPDWVERSLFSVQLWKWFTEPPISTCHWGIPFLTKIYIYRAIWFHISWRKQNKIASSQKYVWRD